MDFAAARRSMVENQLRTNKVTDLAVLDAMGRLPREAFVPDHLTGIAYVDEDLPLGDGRVLMEPLALARLLQAAEIGNNETVMILGAGTGYEVAVVSDIARTVTAVESELSHVNSAVANLAAVGLSDIEIVQGPLTEGWRARSPYDVIVFNGAVAEVPTSIIEQLDEGGRLVAVICGADQRIGKGTVLSRVGGVVSSREVFDAALPWLPGLEPQPGFVF